MHVVIGGASGFLGTALVAHLREQGHQVTRLVRTDDPLSDASLWDPRTGRLDQVVIDRADAVVNLSGSSVAHWPRTGRLPAQAARVPRRHHHHARSCRGRVRQPSGDAVRFGHGSVRPRPR